MFSAIYDSDLALLITLGRTGFLRDHNKPAALLCFDHSFRDFDRQTEITGSDVQILKKTRALYEYAEIVCEILSFPEPWAQRSIQRLFSFTVHYGRVCLPRGTFLHGIIKPSQRSQPLGEDTMVEVRVFFDLYQRTLRRRLREKLEAYSNKSLSVRVFDPCESVAFRRCDRTECQKQHELNHTWFDNRLDFHLCQISILNLLRLIGLGLRENLRRFDF
jgi:hypothetical protein